MKKLVVRLIGRVYPRYRYLFTPVAANVRLSDAQLEVLTQHDIHYIELHVADGFQIPIQETRWGRRRAEDLPWFRETPKDAFFLRRVGRRYELRLGSVFAQQTPDELSKYLDSILQTAVSRIDWIARQTKVPGQPRTYN